MKKPFFLLVSLFLSLNSFATYYVAGNGAAGNPWCDGKSWVVNGSAMDENNSITFQSVPAGSYQFKVTNGTSTWYGYDKFDQSNSNLECDGGGDGNIVFTTTVMHNLTIKYVNSKITLNGDGDEPEVDHSQDGTVGVPSECEDVMLQAFYWNSHSLSTYSKPTKWINLIQDTSLICRDFDLVWFPPATGGSGVGYYATSYSFATTSAWGTKARLKEIVAALNRGGTRSLADIVINHRQSSSGWAKAFKEDDFGAEGKFQLTSEHICAGDEAFTSSSSDSRDLPHGAADTGNNDGGCRDLDHTNPYVQALCKAYVRYMMSEMGFAGFRYDMVIGYGGNFLSEYNLASQPYLSVSEYWSDLSSTVRYLRTARYNTMLFDFPLKYAIKSAINNSNFATLKSTSSSFRGQGLSKYAVTFVDNHDTYGRDNSDYLVKSITDAGAARKVLQANAFILSMPGVPCVFYPHWKVYEREISHMIKLRKAAGIHSESVVTDEVAGSKNYSATIHGHRGSIVLRMGDNRDTVCPSGYTLLYQGAQLDIYLSSDCAEGIDLMTDIVPVELPRSSARKRLVNGRLVIEAADHLYDAHGRML